MDKKYKLHITEALITDAQKLIPFWTQESKSNWDSFALMADMNEMGLARRGAQLNAQAADRRLKMLNEITSSSSGSEIELVQFLSGRERDMLKQIQESPSPQVLFTNFCKPF